MEYYGWTTDGQLFDSSTMRGQTVELQQKNVPKGVWEGAVPALGLRSCFR